MFVPEHQTFGHVKGFQFQIFSGDRDPMGFVSLKEKINYLLALAPQVYLECSRIISFNSESRLVLRIVCSSSNLVISNFQLSKVCLTRVAPVEFGFFRTSASARSVSLSLAQFRRHCDTHCRFGWRFVRPVATRHIPESICHKRRKILLCKALIHIQRS